MAKPSTHPHAEEPSDTEGRPAFADRSPEQPEDATALPESTDAHPAKILISSATLVLSRDGAIRDFVGEIDTTPELVPEDLRGAPVEALLPGKLADIARDQVKRTIRTRRPHAHEFELETQNGNSYHEALFIVQGRDRVLVVVRDISERKTAEAAIRRRAYFDALTGLPNRELFISNLDRVINETRLKGGRAAVVCLDIDNFKRAGAHLGSKAQDDILGVLADRLTRITRGQRRDGGPDQVNVPECARLDSNQFAVLLADVHSGGDAAKVASRIRESLQNPINYRTSEICVTVTIGIAMYPQDGADAETLFCNAEIAMQDAVISNTSRQRFHSGTVRERALKRLDLENELRWALEREQLDLHYLPMIDTETREVVGVEALLRWPHLLRGSEPLGELILLAENTGLIVPISEWVLRRACEQLHTWQSQRHRGLRLAVNVSTQEFARPDLVERVASILSESSIEPQHVDFDVTERVLMRDALADFATCQKLKELGLRIVVDDFGTGVCSLGYLRRSPIDAVKIDRSFVNDIQTDPDNRAIATAIIVMARELGFRVIAEGVESVEQVEVLRELGCELVQGFLFCEPLPASEITEFLDKGLDD